MSARSATSAGKAFISLKHQPSSPKAAAAAAAEAKANTAELTAAKQEAARARAAEQVLARDKPDVRASGNTCEPQHAVLVKSKGKKGKGKGKGKGRGYRIQDSGGWYEVEDEKLADSVHSAANGYSFRQLVLGLFISFAAGTAVGSQSDLLPRVQVLSTHTDLHPCVPSGFSSSGSSLQPSAPSRVPTTGPSVPKWDAPEISVSGYSEWRHDLDWNISELSSLASQGILFVGDSPQRRLYIHSVIHMEGVDDEVIAAELQNGMSAAPQKDWPALLNFSFYDPDQGVANVYTGASGANRGKYNMRFIWEASLIALSRMNWQQVLQSSNAKFVYVGIPFLHVLYKTNWGIEQDICRPTFNMSAAISVLLQALQQAAEATNMVVMIGTGNTLYGDEDASERNQMFNSWKSESKPAVCGYCWRNPICEEFSGTIRGMSIANDLLAGLVASSGYGRLQLLRMDRVTQGQPRNAYLGGGHYKGPVLDQKLGLIIRDALSATRRTLQSQFELLSKQGIVFIGDSPTRRLYVRAIVHLQGIEDEGLAEDMQNNAKQLANQQRINDTDADADANEFTMSGGLHLRYLMIEDLSTDWVQQLAGWDAQFVYFGCPFLHILYNPLWHTKICDPSFIMEQALLAVLQQLQDAAVRLNVTILVGSGNMYSAVEDKVNQANIENPELLPSPRNESCVPCWHKQRCEVFSQTIHGMTAANRVLSDMIGQFGALTLLRMDQITQQQPTDLYLGGGHFKGPVVDQKLAALVAAVWTGTLQLQMPKPEITKLTDIVITEIMGELAEAPRVDWNISELSSLASQGILFVGDSPQRRLYIRAVVQLEGVDGEVTMEGLQNGLSASPATHRPTLLNFSFYTAQHGVANVYTGASGAKRGKYNMRFIWEESLIALSRMNWQQVLQSSNAKFVYVGIPFLHVLYKTNWGIEQDICRPTFNMSAAISVLLQALQQAAEATNMVVMIGTGNTLYGDEDASERNQMFNSWKSESKPAVCGYCWRNPICEEFSGTIRGMSIANDLLAGLVASSGYGRLQLLRMDRVTQGQPRNAYLGGGHYKGPVLDQKLGLIIRDALSATRRTLQSQSELDLIILSRIGQ
jgi:hypothetical protein